MAVAADTLTEPARSVTSEVGNPQEIATLAYEFWQARGCPHGSPEQDWFLAEQELRNRREKNTEEAFTDASDS